MPPSVNGVINAQVDPFFNGSRSSAFDPAFKVVVVIVLDRNEFLGEKADAPQKMTKNVNGVRIIEKNRDRKSVVGSQFGGLDDVRKGMAPSK